MAAEFADPMWVFGESSYAFTPDGAILAAPRADGRDRLLRIDPDGAVHEIGYRIVLPSLVRDVKGEFGLTDAGIGVAYFAPR